MCLYFHSPFSYLIFLTCKNDLILLIDNFMSYFFFQEFLLTFTLCDNNISFKIPCFNILHQYFKICSFLSTFKFGLLFFMLLNCNIFKYILWLLGPYGIYGL